MCGKSSLGEQENADFCGIALAATPELADVGSAEKERKKFKN
jgi:hypothetical protein